MSNELRECPFCGKSDKVIIYTESMAQHGEILWTRYGVKCKRCNFEIPTYAKKAAAIHKWNTRPAENAQQAENEKLKEALRDMCELWEALGKQVPPVLGEQNYIRAKNLLNVPCTNAESMEGKDEHR